MFLKLLSEYNNLYSTLFSIGPKMIRFPIRSAWPRCRAAAAFSFSFSFSPPVLLSSSNVQSGRAAELRVCLIVPFLARRFNWFLRRLAVGSSSNTPQSNRGVLELLKTTPTNNGQPVQNTKSVVLIYARALGNHRRGSHISAPDATRRGPPLPSSAPFQVFILLLHRPNGGRKACQCMFGCRN